MSQGLSSSFYYDTNALRDIRHKGAKGAESEDAELKQVAKQFEGVFTRMMLKSMRDASFSDTLFNSNKTEFYREMFDKQVSQDAAGSMGLADVLYRQLKQTQDSAKLSSSAPSGSAKAEPAEGLPVRPAAAKKFMPIDANRVDSRWQQASLEKPKRDFRYPVSIEREPDFSRITKENFAYLERESVLHGYGPEGGAQALGGVFAPDKRNTVWQSPEQFVRDVWPHARRTAQKMNMDPRVLVAQAALETGWGRQVPKNRDGSLSFNLFGIKADKRWQGRVVKAETLEFHQGNASKQQGQFRSYASLGQAFDNYAEFLGGNKRYEGALSVSHSATQYLRELQRAGYATDPHYARKITRILNSPRLNSIISENRLYHHSRSS